MTTAANIADMANKAEAEILASATEEFRNWYLALPRAVRVEIACAAWEKAAA